MPQNPGTAPKQRHLDLGGEFGKAYYGFACLRNLYRRTEVSDFQITLALRALSFGTYTVRRLGHINNEA